MPVVTQLLLHYLVLGFGYSDVENKVSFTPETVIKIASLSKPMTAVAFMKLWEDKKVKLDDSIEEYVPSWPKKDWHGEEVRSIITAL